MFSQCCKNVAIKKIRCDNVKNTLPQQIHNKSIPETFLQQYTTFWIHFVNTYIQHFMERTVVATCCQNVTKTFYGFL